ncbi:MAG TPA: asparaginase [Elusimicrobia bacterium]|nr:MAG: asparaginase [Elusimicrobia bacterium GWF2_62_30]HBA59378.1 asparaginase [Elusimicrobiota bacterium]
MTIKLIITGGTFDKEYNELNGSLFFTSTHLGEMLKLGRSRVKVKLKTLMMMDSLYMTAAHRKRILAECKASRENRIVITHGTDTMPETARLLGENLTGKTVIITGAMVPYKFGSSDGMFNLGSALSFAQTLPPDVYIAMNGRFFSWHNVRKNKKKGEFEEIK